MNMRRMGMPLIRVLVFKSIRKSTQKRNYTQMWSVRRVSFVAQILTFSIEFTWERVPVILRTVVMASVWPHIFRTFR